MILNMKYEKILQNARTMLRVCFEKIGIIQMPLGADVMVWTGRCRLRQVSNSYNSFI